MKYTTGFEGVMPYIERKYLEAETECSAQRYARVTCARLRARSATASASSPRCSRSPSTATQHRRRLRAQPRQRPRVHGRRSTLTDREAHIAAAGAARDPAAARVPHRGRPQLPRSRPRRRHAQSGGEAQRIRLATQIGSGLTGVLYVLDEPSIGLHQRDNRRLIETLVKLKNLGNTLIVVEHDEDTIRTADWIVDIGPGAGELGGEVVHSGSYESLLENTDRSPATTCPGDRDRDPANAVGPTDPERQITVVGAKANNLQECRRRASRSACSPPSPASAARASPRSSTTSCTRCWRTNSTARARFPAGTPASPGSNLLDKVVHVDQAPIGRTPRSNPATYTGVFDRIRTLFSETAEAKARGYLPGRFSFNVKGGRCENCSGDGTIKIEMNFLPDVYVACEVCGGARYNRDTLTVHYKGKNIAEVLDMPIAEAADFFEAISSIHRYLQDAGRGRTRIRAARPERHDAVRRRGAARQAGDRTAASRDGQERLCTGRADHGPALRGRA